jgi:hypothetical protein
VKRIETQQGRGMRGVEMPIDIDKLTEAELIDLNCRIS